MIVPGPSSKDKDYSLIGMVAGGAKRATFTTPNDGGMRVRGGWDGCGSGGMARHVLSVSVVVAEYSSMHGGFCATRGGGAGMP